MAIDQILWDDGTDIQWDDASQILWDDSTSQDDGTPLMSKQRAQSSTTYPMNFLIVQSSDHVTGLTGATPTVTISKNGAAFGSPSGAVTEIGNGWYSLAGNATDRGTLGEFLIHATAASGDPTDEKYEIITQDAFAAQFAANTTQWNGTNVASPATAGIPDINVKNINNTAAATPGASGGAIINGANAGALTESYAALNAAPTINQLLYEVRSLLAQVSISGTTLTTQKIDGSTTAETFTLNSSSAPTAITRAS